VWAIQQKRILKELGLAIVWEEWEEYLLQVKYSSKLQEQDL
jgi:hypothetical protein